MKYARSRRSARPGRVGRKLASALERVRGFGARHRRWLVVIGLVVVGIGFGGVGAALGAWTRACAHGCPTAVDIDRYSPQQATEVYAADGELLGLFYRERRQVISLDALPSHVPAAFLAVEDQRFWEHEGIDMRRMIAVLRDNVFGGWGESGGSTVTMQLARNLFPQQLPVYEKSLRRKFAEIRLAREIEQTLSKAEILELYLNHIYLGSGAYGIEAAAKTYFGKGAADLTELEAATLAGLPKAPSHYNPRRNPDAALQRRNVALQRMREVGLITAAEQATLRVQPLALAPPRGAVQAPYFVEHVRRELEDRFGELLYTGGLKIYTTLDPKLQDTAEEALEAQLSAIEAGRYGAYRRTTHAEFDESLPEGGRATETNTPYLQGVLTVMDPTSGAVLALVGGRDFDHSQFNRATQALRQPGSAFKPFVYGAALEAGRSPLEPVSDAPIFLTQDDGSIWAPRNYSGDHEGTLSLREALRRSKNMVAIRLGQEVGIEKVRDFARRAGVTSPIPPYPSVFIGSAGVRPLELIAAYAPFANGGMRVEPRFIRRIEHSDGRLLWEPSGYALPTIDPAVAWLLTDMLREVVDRGTAYNIRNPAVGNLPYDIPAAGKTGTTNDNTDVWFIGYTPDVLAGVWIGMDRPQRIFGGATGGGFATPIWAQLVRSFYEDRDPPQAWERPEGIQQTLISPWTGLPVTEDCPYAAGASRDYVVAAAAPQPGCEPPRYEDEDPYPWLPGRPVRPDGRGPRAGDFNR